VVELTRMAQDLDTSLYKPIQLYAAAGLLYFVINRAIAWAGATAERRLAWGRA
jgi:polar amino acid transport system permease protein